MNGEEALRLERLAKLEKQVATLENQVAALQQSFVRSVEMFDLQGRFLGQLAEKLLAFAESMQAISKRVDTTVEHIGKLSARLEELALACARRLP